MPSNKKDPDLVDLILGLNHKVCEVFASVGDQDEISSLSELTFTISNKIRMERALSWLIFDIEKEGTDTDLSFISTWIAFESLYSNDQRFIDKANNRDHKSRTMVTIKTFIKNILSTPGEKENALLREAFQAKKVITAMNDIFANPFVNPQCWDNYYKGSTKAGKRSKTFVNKNTTAIKKNLFFDKTQFSKNINELFHRLYCLRNTIFHGNASHKRDARDERSDQHMSGTLILRSVVPVMVQLMLDDLTGNIDDEKWGKVPYPRIKKGA